MQKLYEKSNSAVRIDGYINQWSPSTNRCSTKTYLVTTAVCENDRLGVTEITTGGIIWSKDAHLCDLDFADDIALLER